MGAAIVGVIVVVIVVFVVWKSFHSIGPTEVGLVKKRFAFRKLDEDNPIAFHGEAGYQADAADAGPAVQALADLRREEVPVGAGARGRDRRRDRAGRRAAADRREERACTSPSSATSPTSHSFIERRRAEGRAAAGAAAGHAGADPPGRVPRAHARRRSTACRCRPTSPTQAKARRRSRPESFGLTPEQLRVVVIAPTSAAATWSASSPRSRASRCRRATSRAGSAASTTSRDDGARGGRAPHGRRGHRGAARQQERPAQQLPGLPGVPRQRRQDRPAARPAAVRRVPAEPVPRARRDGADARRQPGRGRGHQGATSACRRSTRRARSSSSARSCVPATAASGRSRCAPASTRSTRACYAAEIVPTSILTLNWADADVDGAQPRRAAVADRGARAARASCSRSTCRCRSTCPTRGRRRSSRWSARCRTS